jgi:FG-GAP-like repeat
LQAHAPTLTVRRATLTSESDLANTLHPGNRRRCTRRSRQPLFAATPDPVPRLPKYRTYLRRTAGHSAVGNIPTNWTVVGVADFNGDGKSDIVWRDTAGDTAIWLMNGAAASSTGGLGNIGTTWSIVQTGDYNADGMGDLLWRDMSGDTAIWFMNGLAVSSTALVGNISTVWTVQSVNAE